MIAFALHSGCHDLDISNDEKRMVQQAIDGYGSKGFEWLREGMTALDAVERVAMLMEDDPIFDAGTGSFLNLANEVEMDAIIADHRSNSGSVLVIKNVRNPISVARKVMENTPHVMLAGEGAVAFARRMGFDEYDPAREQLRVGLSTEGKQRLLHDISLYNTYRKSDSSFSTIGVVALDTEGRLAAGSSTGGIRDKIPGRVGDTGIFGAGTYCDSRTAVVATGEGEKIYRLALSRMVALHHANGTDLQEACRILIEQCRHIDCICGVLALNQAGECAWGYNGPYMGVFSRHG